MSCEESIGWASVSIQPYFDTESGAHLKKPETLGRPGRVSSGFMYRRKGEWFLVCSWKGLTGIDPYTINSLPNWPTVTALDHYTPPSGYMISFFRKDIATKSVNLGERVQVFFTTNLDERLSSWFVHPKHRQGTDVAVIPLETIEQDAPEALTLAANEIAMSAMSVQLADDIYIVGFPFGTHLHPVWKRATVAQDPQLMTELAQPPYYLIDTGTYEGLWGAPVYRYSNFRYRTEDGKVLQISQGSVAKLIGVFTGEFPVQKPGSNSKIGIVRPIELVNETIDAKSLHAWKELSPFAFVSGLDFN